MTAENTTDKAEYNYVWECRKDNPARGESIPMRKGDYLFICIGADGCATFRYRKCDWRKNPEPCKVTSANEKLWAGATAQFFPDTGRLTGALAGGERQFAMTLHPKKGTQGFTITCKHFRNPDEGDWEADDVWGGQQQG